MVALGHWADMLTSKGFVYFYSTEGNLDDLSFERSSNLLSMEENMFLCSHC